MTLSIRNVSDLRAGDIGFTGIRGMVGAGVLAAQTAIDLAALLRGRRADTAGWLTHAYVVTQVAGGPGHVATYANVVEAMPSGARKVTLLGDDRIGPGYAYARLQIDAHGMPITDYQRQFAAERALRYVGRPYGFAAYAAIAALTLQGGESASADSLLARYVNRRDGGSDVYPHDLLERPICSALADDAYMPYAQLFDDGRPPAYVTPAALFWRCAQLGEVVIL